MQVFKFLAYLAIIPVVNLEFCSRGTWFIEHNGIFYKALNTLIQPTSSLLQCSHICLSSDRYCSSINFKKTREPDGKHICMMVFDEDIDTVDGLAIKEDWIFLEKERTARVSDYCKTVFSSCKEIKLNIPSAEDGKYWLKVNNYEFQVYCDMSNGGYTLIARLSNADAKNWMRASGAWWYDLLEAGNTTSTLENADMLSPAFSMVEGTDIKVTRSDDLTHNALLHAPDCIANHTMRHKISSYGNFRNGVIWTASNKCHGRCSASFTVDSTNTEGFKYVDTSCSTSNDILDKGNIGFWCQYDRGDGSVVMFGGGGASCSRADHGLGITEKNIAAFGNTDLGYFDFGNDARNGPPTSGYSLNLWLR